MRVLDHLAFGKAMRRLLPRRQPREAKERALVLASGLFDAAFYLAEAPDVAAAGVDPLDHFLAHGWRESRRPNPVFDPGWYRHLFLCDRASTNPLVHYVEQGEAAGCRPVAWFDPAWYAQAYGAAAPLRHYLAHRHTRGVAPNGGFDLAFYLAAHGEAIGAGRDPFSHLVEHGGLDLDPSADFDAAGYRRAHMRGGSLIGAAARELRVPLVHQMDAQARASAGVAPYAVKLGAVHMPVSEIAALADVYRRGGREAEAFVDEMRAMEPALLRGYLLPFRVAIRLRETHATALAEQLLNLFVDEPVLRSLALNELMSTKAYDGRPDEATRCFEALDREGAPTLAQRKLASWCYARAERPDRALALLAAVAAENPGLREECAASAQFYAFYQTYGLARANALYRELCETFPRAPSVAALEAEIGVALRDKQPYLLLRLGDGEGSVIHISDKDEAENVAYYAANRREFANSWFGDESTCENPSFRRTMRVFNATIAEADCIGCIYRDVIDHEYRIGSRRGIAWVINTMRAVLRLGRDDPDWAARTMICRLPIHYDLLVSGALGRLIAESGRVGLITCHAELPARLEARYGVEVFEFHKIPGEKISGAALGQDAVAGTHWPDRYRELATVLDEPVDRRGQLFLVAGGILGKIYAGKLKRAGAVVLDIGAAADLWMGKATREFPHLPCEASLDL